MARLRLILPLFLVCFGLAAQSPRYALVVGNGNYEFASLGQTPINDANAMRDALILAGFEVDFYTNLGYFEFTAAMRAFSEKINQSKGVALFYYSGHGVQLENANYLVPIGAKFNTADDIKEMCVPLSRVTARMKNAGTSPNIVLLDACRSFPIPSDLKSVTQGLAKEDFVVPELIVSYATEAGSTAAIRGENGLSLYTSQLIKHLKTPGLVLETVLKNTRRDVLTKSNNQQRPDETGNLISDFYFFLEKQNNLAPDPEPDLSQIGFRPDDFVQVPGGIFQMGSETGSDDEKPVHSVTVPAFDIGKYEVTVAQFRAFIEETKHQTDADKEGSSYVWTGSTYEKKNGVNWRCGVAGNQRPASEYNHPVIHVSWNDATAYCKWLSQKTGHTYRLPSEAEWEFAAKGGKASKGYEYAGSDALEAVAWFNKNSNHQTHPVGQKAANELGLYDMSGNVWEWCADTSHENYAGAPADGSAWITGGEQDRAVLRGGAWGNNDSYCRAAYRNRIIRGGRNHVIGFRVTRAAAGQ